jgi:hypothetical protein
MTQLQSQLDSLKLVPFSEVDEKALNANPGICLLRYKGKWAYVGMSSNIRRRYREDTQLTGDLSQSALRRTVCEFLEIADASVTTQKPAVLSRAQVAPIHDWLRTCEIGFLEAPTDKAASALKAQAIETLSPFLNKKNKSLESSL